jgi:uncharacterized protein (DUF433 family)
MNLFITGFNADQADKVLRLSEAGVDDAELARRYGCDDKQIQAAKTAAAKARQVHLAERNRKLMGVA